MSTDPNAAILRAIEALGEKIDGVEKRLGAPSDPNQDPNAQVLAAVLTAEQRLAARVDAATQTLSVAFAAAAEEIRAALAQLREDVLERHQAIVERVEDLERRVDELEGPTWTH